jgi:hypothetical protein
LLAMVTVRTFAGCDGTLIESRPRQFVRGTVMPPIDCEVASRESAKSVAAGVSVTSPEGAAVVDRFMIGQTPVENTAARDILMTLSAPVVPL